LLSEVNVMASGFNEKIDAFDLIINALKEHEKKLDAISNDLENLFKRHSTEKKKDVNDEKTMEKKHITREPLIICKEWSDFKESCIDATKVAFEIDDDSFKIDAISNEGLFRYLEELPPKRLKIVEELSQFSIDKKEIRSINLFQFLVNRRLKCGLIVSLKNTKITPIGKQFLLELEYNLETEMVKEFLSNELGLSKRGIVQGKIIL